MKILVACGGTGGHIFPALSFLSELESKKQDLDILLTVSKRAIERRIIPKKYKTSFIDISPVRLKLDTHNLLSVLRFFKAGLESLRIIIKFHPDVVVGFGGYASFLIVFFAWGLG